MGLRQEDRAIHWRLLGQTTWPVVAIGVLLLTAGIYGAWRVHRLQTRGSNILSENVASIRAAEELETHVLEIRYRLKRFLSTGNDRHLGEIQSLLPKVQQWKEQAGKLATTTREQQLFARLDRGFARLESEFEALDGETREAVARPIADHLSEEVIPNRILDNTKKYVRLNEIDLADSDQQNRSTANQLMFGLIILGTCGGVAGLISGYVIAHRVHRTIFQLSLPIRDTAGKLDKVVGPISVAADPNFDDLESMLKTVSANVTTVVERLQESEREMLRAEQLAAMGQLAAGLGHELRNPLTSLKTILQLADEPEDLTTRDLEVLKQEMGRLEEGVQTFLDFARPPQPKKRHTDLRPLILETIDLVARRAERKSVKLTWDIEEGEFWVWADSAQVRQVVLNLLVNALDAVPIGGQVHVACRTSQAPTASRPRRISRPSETNGHPARSISKAGGRPCCEIRVADNGPGLSGGLGERIFEPFVSTKESGLGLGLSICKRILEAHGGTISAADGESTMLGGAMLTTTLPLADETPSSREKIYAESTDRR